MLRDGWEKQSNSWYQQRSDVLIICDLQRSNYSPAYFINIGIAFYSGSRAGRPRTREAALDWRVENLVLPEDPKRLHCLLDLNCAISDEERIAGLAELFNQSLFPLLSLCTSIDTLRAGGPARVLVDRAFSLKREALFLADPETLH